MDVPFWEPVAGLCIKCTGNVFACFIQWMSVCGQGRTSSQGQVNQIRSSSQRGCTSLPVTLELPYLIVMRGLGLGQSWQFRSGGYRLSPQPFRKVAEGRLALWDSNLDTSQMSGLTSWMDRLQLSRPLTMATVGASSIEHRAFRSELDQACKLMWGPQKGPPPF